MRTIKRFLIGSLAILFLLGCHTAESQPTGVASAQPVPSSETHVHDWVDATCTEPKTCRSCGLTEGEPLGHDFSDATCTEPKTCRRCGLSEGEPLGHDFAGATCTEPGICTRCGAEDAPLGHDWIEACMLPKICRRCGASEGEASGHRMVGNTCSECGYTVFETISGSGNAVLNDIQTGSAICRVHFSHTGDRDFTVWAYDSNGSADLLFSKRGAYDGSVLLFGEAPFTVEIFSRTAWKLSIEQLDFTAETSFSGAEDAVTDLCPRLSGTFRFIHTGENDFVVWLYTSNGETLLVHEQGPCEIERLVTVPEGSFAFFAVRSDAAWTIERIGDPA